MTTSHEVNLSIFRMVRDMLLHDDGSLKPVGGMDGKVNPQWAYARASNIAQAICGNFVVFPLPRDQASGEIGPPSRYGFEQIKDEPPVKETMEQHAERVIK